MDFTCVSDTEEAPEMISLSRKCFYFLKSCSMCVHTLLFCGVMKLRTDKKGAADGTKAWAFLHFLLLLLLPVSRTRACVVTATVGKGVRGSRGCWDGERARAESSISLSLRFI